MAPKTIVFDLNETLLDLSAMDPVFQHLFGAAEVRKLWFGQVLELFLTATVIDVYRPFGELTDAALEMVARQRGVRLDDADRERVREALRALPAYPDVRPALERLEAAGLTLATLTNSGERSARQLLERNGLTALFDAVLSVDAVRRYKPAREAYEHAAKQLDVQLGDIRLVAAHGWDVAGALAAGCAAAFVERPEQAVDPPGERPDVVGRDLHDVAERILATHG